MKIKTFEFVVNCWRGSFLQNAAHGDEKKLGEVLAVIDRFNVSKSDDIDETINSYIKDKEVISVNENFYTALRHNNGGQDTIIRSITVITK